MSLWEKEGSGTMSGSEIVKKKARELTPKQSAELAALADRVRGRLQQSAADILALGADLIRAKAMLGHGQFGAWLDVEFAQSRRSAEQFMSAARRFGTRSEAVSHLPAGSVIELSAPSVPEELVDQVLAGEVPASVSAIREEKKTARGEDRSYAVAGTFIDHIERFNGTGEDLSVAIVAHVLRRWKDPVDREWLQACLEGASEILTDNLERRVPALELPRTTVKRLKREQVR